MEPYIMVANNSHLKHAKEISEMIEGAAKIKGNGIAKRKSIYIENKITEGKVIIALSNNRVVGFCYIESWEDKKYVANSGLIVHPDYRKSGLAKAIKKAAFEHSKKLFPNSKLFGLTTNLAVMKINFSLGYKPVTYTEITKDKTFWEGCNSCEYFDILHRTNHTMCLCTGMVCDITPANSVSSMEKKKIWADFMQHFDPSKLKIKQSLKYLSKLQKVKK